MTGPGQPHQRVEFVDAPAIVGARWWNSSVMAAPDAGRRQALIALAAAAGVMAVGMGALITVGVVAAASSDEDTLAKDSLEMQRQYGWSFGSGAEKLTFDGIVTAAFDRTTLAALPTDLAPAQASLKPYYQPALFQSAWESPREPDPTGAPAAVALRDALTPIFTPAMETAYARGKALASLFDNVPADTAVVVDLPGPEAVAFAAGMAERFEPVFTFDNWPHPRGVVPAHLTLAAACYYRPLFVRAAGARRAPAAPVFVLDRDRLSAYAEDSEKFDNRYLAKLPSGEALRALGIKHVLYVAAGPEPLQVPQEQDDLNLEFVAYEKAEIDVKSALAADFQGQGGASHYYGGSEASHRSFWSNYGWHAALPVAGAILAAGVSRGYTYQPSARATMFGAASGAASVKPPGFGAVWVATSRSTGKIVRCTFGRSGSWSRSPGGG